MRKKRVSIPSRTNDPNAFQALLIPRSVLFPSCGGSRSPTYKGFYARYDFQDRLSQSTECTSLINRSLIPILKENSKPEIVARMGFEPILTDFKSVDSACWSTAPLDYSKICSPGGIRTRKFQILSLAALPSLLRGFYSNIPAIS